MKYSDKPIKGIISIIMLTLGISTAIASNTYIRYITDKSSRKASVTFLDGKKYSGTIIIPEYTSDYYGDYTVSSIGTKAFFECTKVKEISIPNTVTHIGAQAFYGCKGLKNISIPKSVKYISSNAFTKSGWYNKQPDGVLYLGDCCLGYKGKKPIGDLILKEGTRIIADNAFENCIGLTSIKIPNSVETIGYKAFCGCIGITEITIPNSVNYIDLNAFAKCISLRTINYNAIDCTAKWGSYVDEWGFKDCNNVTTINIGKDVERTPYCIFLGCENVSEVNFNADFCHSMHWAFDTQKLSKVNIGNNVYKIPDNAFSSCKQLKSINIPNSVSIIGNNAFYNCNGLTSIVIPNSVRQIGASAFERCELLSSVSIGNSIKQIGEKAFDNTRCINNIDGICYIGNYCLGPSYSSTDIVVIKEGTTLVADKAFEKSYITTLMLPRSLVSIGEYAFYDCRKLETIISLSPTPPSLAFDALTFGAFDKCDDVTLYVPNNHFASYYMNEKWGKFKNLKKIKPLVSKIDLDWTELSLDRYCKCYITATTYPIDAMAPFLFWESSNPSVAEVNQDGIVTTVSGGTAIITASAIDGSGVSSSCKVYVESPSLSISRNKINLPVNDLTTLTCHVQNSSKTPIWSTSDASIVGIKTNQNGLATIVGIANGIAIVTATIVDGGVNYSASCKVIVGNGN